MAAAEAEADLSGFHSTGDVLAAQPKAAAALAADPFFERPIDGKLGKS